MGVNRHEWRDDGRRRPFPVPGGRDVVRGGVRAAHGPRDVPPPVIPVSWGESGDSRWGEGARVDRDGTGGDVEREPQGTRHGCGARARPVLHLRGDGVEAVRLQGATRPRIGLRQRAWRRAHLHAPGGAWDRPGQQGRCVQAAGRGGGHGRREPDAGFRGRRETVRLRALHPRRHRREKRATDDQQPDESARALRPRREHRRHEARHRAPEPVQ
mmetsp:Transcript_19800/g.47973  ORF Transcript_19800/g.47973 Transcript_19800/m.47973 type:complete len:214 (+) Transcript_19800:521-1162(+)